MTLAELLAMAEARRRDEWDRWSLLMMLVANPNRDAKKHPEPFTPDDFNPFAALKPAAPIPMVPISVLKDVFCKE